MYIDPETDGHLIGDPINIVDTGVINVVSDPIISWNPLGSIRHSGGAPSSVDLPLFINNYTEEVVITVHVDTPLPSGFTLSPSGVLTYSPIIARSIILKFVATLGNQVAESDSLLISQNIVSTFTLTPNRIYLDIAFDQDNDKLWLFSASTINVNPTVRYIDSFNLDGTHNIADSLVFNSGMLTGDDWIIPNQASGMAYVDGDFWICGSRPGGDILKMTASGQEIDTYSVQSTHQIDSLTYDGTYLWGLDIATRRIRAYNTGTGAEVTSATIALLSSEFTFNTSGRHAITQGDGHFWIRDNNTSILKCVGSNGRRVGEREVSVLSHQTAAFGMIYNNDTQNLWYATSRGITERECYVYGIHRPTPIGT